MPALFLFLYTAANAIFQSYMSLFLASNRLSEARIGAIFAAMSLTGIAALPLFGTLSDRSSDRRHVLAALTLAAALTMAGLGLVKGFLPLLLVGCAFSAFYTSVQPLGDAVILDALNRRGQPFGRARLAGAAGFAVSSVIGGRYLSGAGRGIAFCTAILCLTLLPASMLLPADAPPRAQKRSFGALLKDRSLLGILLLILPMELTVGGFHSFFSPIFLTLRGANGTLLGLCYLIATLGEIPFLLVADRLFERLGVKRLLFVAAVAFAARWLTVAVAENAYVALASQLLHGWSFSVVMFAASKRVALTVPEALRASGQMLLAMTCGIARALGSLLGGAIHGQALFYVSAAVCGIAALLILRSGCFRKERETASPAK